MISQISRGCFAPVGFYAKSPSGESKELDSCSSFAA